MQTQPRPSSPTLEMLNATPLSRHVSSVMTKAGVKPQPHNLVLMELLEWATVNQPWPTADDELGALAAWEAKDPAEAYAMLAQEDEEETLAGPLLEAQTLPEMAEALEGMLADWLDDRSVSPSGRRWIPHP